MGRLLPAMDMLQLLMADMLLSAMDMTLLHMDMNRPQLERSVTDMLLSATDMILLAMNTDMLQLPMADTLLPTRGYVSLNLNSSTMSRICTSTLGLVSSFKGGKLIADWN